MRKILALFPGQGSQRVGMGKALADSSPTARSLLATADDALGFPLSSLCFHGPAETLTMTANAQPAILAVSSACFQLAQEHWKDKVSVVAAAGHSLGEYSSLVAAGALAFQDAVRLVHRRGTFMQEATPAGLGTMVAVMGVDEDTLQQRCAEACAQSGEVVEIANVNTREQIVVAGTKRATATLVELLKGVRTVELQVSAPFHCSLMQPAATKLATELTSVAFQAPRFPVYANWSAAPVSTPVAVREALAEQVCGRVRWVASIEQALADHNPEVAVEFGCGNILTGLMKRIAPQLPRVSIDSVEAIEQFVR